MLFTKLDLITLITILELVTLITLLGLLTLIITLGLRHSLKAGLDSGLDSGLWTLESRPRVQSPESSPDFRLCPWTTYINDNSWTTNANYNVERTGENKVKRTNNYVGLYQLSLIDPSLQKS